MIKKTTAIADFAKHLNLYASLTTITVVIFLKIKIRART